jgi:hypothetical protein
MIHARPAGNNVGRVWAKSENWLDESGDSQTVLVPPITFLVKPVSVRYFPELALLFLRFILAPFWSPSPLYFCQPLGRPASSFTLSNCQAFQHHDGFGDLIALRSQVRQHFVNIHFSSVP